MKLAITGGTGFIGRRLVRRILDEGRDGVRVFTRDAVRAKSCLPPEVDVVAWEPVAGPPPPGALEGVGAVINLAGESVAQRWTQVVKQRIRESRITSTRNLVAGIIAARERPPVLVSTSAVGYYGARGDEPLDEGAPAGSGFLPALCREWEEEASRAGDAGIRVAAARLGVVLGPRGGALSRMLPYFKICLGGPLGDGRQWMSWIHIDDAVGILLHAARTEAISGPANAVAPGPVQNLEFARALGRALGRPAGIPTPAGLLKVLLGEFSEFLLTGQRVIPRKVEASGYRFRFPELDGALKDVLSQ